MPDIIQLLPESVANQIAAGEVVQRPASVVKELLENSIDAGATQIKLVVKDAGKTLVQVTDNGSGMSESDARMSFERHATSKIRVTEDLFRISTKGFRGEALASIAAVAQVELKTRRKEDELGVSVNVEGSELKQHELVQCPEGTTFMVKNLFFNVPARRYFLKSDPIELKHIVDEFQRVALTHPEVAFTFSHNAAEVFNLPVTTLRQRIVHVFGNKYNEKLVPVDESTDIVAVHGFVGKPDATRKTRGEQFFFVNHRFIRSAYLHHAVMSAFEGLIPQGTFPFYVLYFEVDPAQIDINIHPTKTEIKFQDERSIYAILHASIRRALGRFNVSPTIDFDQESSIRVAPFNKNADVRPPSIQVNQHYNPFGQYSDRPTVASGWPERKPSASDWKELMEIGIRRTELPGDAAAKGNEVIQHSLEVEVDERRQLFQLHNKYIVVTLREGVGVIDQQRAHQRVLFEKFMHQLEQGAAPSQQLLFPEKMSPGNSGFAMFSLWREELENLGFAFTLRDQQTIEITGLPVDVGAQHPQRLVEDLLARFADETDMDAQDRRQKIAWAMAKTASIRPGQMMTRPEMEGLVEDLLQCDSPSLGYKGALVMTIFTLNQLDTIFR